MLIKIFQRHMYCGVVSCILGCDRSTPSDEKTRAINDDNLHRCRHKRSHHTCCTGLESGLNITFGNPTWNPPNIV